MGGLSPATAEAVLLPSSVNEKKGAPMRAKSQLAIRIINKKGAVSYVV